MAEYQRDIQDIERKWSTCARLLRQPPVHIRDRKPWIDRMLKKKAAKKDLGENLIFGHVDEERFVEDLGIMKGESKDDSAASPKTSVVGTASITQASTTSQGLPGGQSYRERKLAEIEKTEAVMKTKAAEATQKAHETLPNDAHPATESTSLARKNAAQETANKMSTTPAPVGTAQAAQDRNTAPTSRDKAGAEIVADLASASAAAPPSEVPDSYVSLRIFRLKKLQYPNVEQCSYAVRLGYEHHVEKCSEEELKKKKCVQTEFKSSSETGAECVIQQQLFLPQLTSKKIVADIFRHHDTAVASSHSGINDPEMNQYVGTVSELEISIDCVEGEFKDFQVLDPNSQLNKQIGILNAAIVKVDAAAVNRVASKQIPDWPKKTVLIEELMDGKEKGAAPAETAKPTPATTTSAAAADSSAASPTPGPILRIDKVTDIPKSLLLAACNGGYIVDPNSKQGASLSEDLDSGKRSVKLCIKTGYGNMHGGHRTFKLQTQLKPAKPGKGNSFACLLQQNLQLPAIDSVLVDPETNKDLTIDPKHKKKVITLALFAFGDEEKSHNAVEVAHATLPVSSCPGVKPPAPGAKPSFAAVDLKMSSGTFVNGGVTGQSADSEKWALLNIRLDMPPDAKKMLSEQDKKAADLADDEDEEEDSGYTEEVANTGAADYSGFTKGGGKGDEETETETETDESEEEAMNQKGGNQAGGKSNLKGSKKGKGKKGKGKGGKKGAESESETETETEEEATLTEI